MQCVYTGVTTVGGVKDAVRVRQLMRRRRWRGGAADEL